MQHTAAQVVTAVRTNRQSCKLSRFAPEKDDPHQHVDESLVKQQLCLFEGVAVPRKLIAAFEKALVSGNHSSRRQAPFSYSCPLPAFILPLSESQLRLPKCGNIVTPQLTCTPVRRQLSDRLKAKKNIWESIIDSKMQHLQYNSPMQLYSRESAEEQYRLQATEAARNEDLNAPLGGSDRKFDPNKSETLKAIREQDNTDEFGKNFFSKIAQAEAPKVPVPTEPVWANEARAKSERARSQTPLRNYSSFISDGGHLVGLTGPPPTFTSGPELQPNPSVLQEWQHQRRSASVDRHHYPSSFASHAGYQFGGMDFIDHNANHNQQYASFNQCNTYPTIRETHKESTPVRPGYNYGLDYNTQNRHIDDSDRYAYHGYGPQKPKLRSKYEADTHAPINTYTSSNFENVNPVRLIGDTVSNQKIQHEHQLTEQEKNAFGLSFGHGGFKRDHVAVKPVPQESEPICYSLSAKKRPQSVQPNQIHNSSQYQHVSSRSVRSKTPDASNNDRFTDYKNVNINTLLNDDALRVTRTEVKPDWANRSNLKHYSWQSRVVDPSQNRPSIPQQEPNWTNSVHASRDAWEQNAQRLDTHVQLPAAAKVPPTYPPYWADRSNAAHFAWSGQNYENGVPHNSYRYVPDSFIHGRQNSTQFHQSQQSNQAYQTHQTHQPYQQPQSYQAPRQQTHQYDQQSYNLQSSTTNQSARSFGSEPKTTYSYQQTIPHVQQSPAQVINESSSTSKIENRSVTGLPAPSEKSVQSSYTEQRNKRSEHRTIEERVISAPPPPPPEERRIIQQNDYNRYYKKHTSEQQAYLPDGKPLPPVRSSVVDNQSQEDFNRHAEMNEELIPGSLANAKMHAEGNFTDPHGHNISYKRDLSTSVDPSRECQLLKEEERRVVEEPVEPGVVSRHVTTKFYKKKTVTDTSTVN